MVFGEIGVSDRRTFIKRASVTAGLATVPAVGAATEDPGNNKQRRNTVDLALEDEELSFANPGQVRQLEAQQQRAIRRGPPETLQDEPGDLVAVDPDEVDFEAALDAINDANEAGNVSFERRDGEIYVVPADEDVHSAGDITIQHHGKNDWDTSISWRYGIRDTLWMNNNLTRDVRNTLTITGGLTGAASKITTATVVGIPAAPLLVVLTALQVIGAGLLTTNNEGHGVRIRGYRPVTWVQVRPQ